MKIQFLGAARTVTGACFYIESRQMRMLVECGMFQGENSYSINREPFSFRPSEIDCLFLTHSHIDHTGLVPRLVKEGFGGRILATPAAIDLAEIMLYDSAHIQESDSVWLTKKALRAGKEPVQPLYTADDVRAVTGLFRKVPYGKIEHTGKGIKYRFLDAGHILGSGSLEIWFQEGPNEKK